MHCPVITPVDQNAWYFTCVLPNTYRMFCIYLVQHIVSSLMIAPYVNTFTHIRASEILHHIREEFVLSKELLESN